MAKRSRKTIRKDNPDKPELPDRKFSEDKVHKENLETDKITLESREELSERPVFTGDEDFYKSLAGSGRASVAGRRRDRAGPRRPMGVSIPYKRFSRFQKVIAGSIVVVTVVLLYALLKPYLGLVTHRQRLPVAQRKAPRKSPIEGHRKVVPQQSPDSGKGVWQSTQRMQESETVLLSVPPLSLKAAHDLYVQKDYDEAYEAYNQLLQCLPAGAEEQLLRDFLGLQMALCKSKTADFKQASQIFRTILQSRSPVVRVLANYYISFIEMQRGQYLKARTRAYRALALIDAVDLDIDRASSLRSDCHFLAAESVTRHMLSLCDADKDIPEDLWCVPMEIGTFDSLNEEQLRLLLNSGSEQLNKGLLGPRVQKLRQKGAASCWSVVCHGPSIEELLARFAANAGLDIFWVSSSPSDGQEAQSAVRQRTVSLYLSAVSTQQFITVAAGHVGLLARLEEKGRVSVYNPADYSSLSQYISVLSQEAISLWQRFLLAFHHDQRVPNAHLALGLLQAQTGQVTESIAEYKLVANRYPQISLAPFALLHSSRLKSRLHDYVGAREDLKQLVEQYPDSELSSLACLHLADATMRAGLLQEAGQLYRKVYHLGYSLQSQRASALEAGRCFYRIKNYEEAAKWLTRYISLAPDKPSQDLYLAYLLLGKTYLAQGLTQKACGAFQHALAGQLTQEEYAETVSALVEAQIQMGCFIDALVLLENISPWQLSQKGFIEMLLLKSKIFRTIGLVDKAAATLGDRAQYIRDPELKAKISFELSKCYIAQGDLELARQKLTEILIFVEPGPLAHEITIQLADVCLRLNQHSQAISICSQLLDSAPSTQIKARALDILATAYNRQKNYDRAALAILGRWNDAKGPTEKRGFELPRAETTGTKVPLEVR